MRTSSLLGILLLLFSPHLIGQSIYEIVVKKSPPPPGINLCHTGCNECGKLIFITFISDLKFESVLGNIKEQRVVREVNADGYQKFTYHVVTMAMPIQHIIIKGPNVADYDLTVVDLKPIDCQDFLVNFVKTPSGTTTGSVSLTTIPTEATITINGEPQLDKVTPYFIKDHPTGTFRIKLEKAGYYPIDTIMTIKPNESSEITVTLKPARGIIKPKDIESTTTESPEYLQNRIKKHGRNQTYWLASTIVAGGVGGYFMYAADQKYQEYLKSSDSQAAQLHKTFDLYDKLGPVFFGLAGVCALEFTIQTIKKGKSKTDLRLHMNGLGAKLSYRF